ncbi:hypothetical protein B0H13DRAFT_1899034 [Mycena leptocephala]|nr:hypothetical protein B0H13DRAFT_1899034 [Mycena leptocephala]
MSVELRGIDTRETNHTPKRVSAVEERSSALGDSRAQVAAESRQYDGCQEQGSLIRKPSKTSQTQPLVPHSVLHPKRLRNSIDKPAGADEDCAALPTLYKPDSPLYSGISSVLANFAQCHHLRRLELQHQQAYDLHRTPGVPAPAHYCIHAYAARITAADSIGTPSMNVSRLPGERRSSSINGDGITPVLSCVLRCPLGTPQRLRSPSRMGFMFSARATRRAGQRRCTMGSATWPCERRRARVACHARRMGRWSYGSRTALVTAPQHHRLLSYIHPPDIPAPPSIPETSLSGMHGGKAADTRRRSFEPAAYCDRLDSIECSSTFCFGKRSVQSSRSVPGAAIRSSNLLCRSGEESDSFNVLPTAALRTVG